MFCPGYGMQIVKRDMEGDRGQLHLGQEGTHRQLQNRTRIDQERRDVCCRVRQQDVILGQ
jgi:hypothetical protein